MLNVYSTMQTTIDRLEEVTYRKKRKQANFFKELKVLAVIVWVSTLFLLVFTNAQLFFGGISESFENKTNIVDRDHKNSHQDNSISQMISSSSNEIKKIHSMIDDFKAKDEEQKAISPSSASELKSKIKEYPFEFNTLPPTNRLIIPSENLDIPLITSKYKWMEDFNDGKYDEELHQWVVKYPTTPEPWTPGNTLIFGHTSVEYWKKNPYATVFKDIPTLQNGDKIKLVREWTLHKYKVVDQKIVLPKDVNKTFLEFQNKDKDYITLMGCYPIGTSKKRYLVIAEESKS